MLYEDILDLEPGDLLWYDGLGLAEDGHATQTWHACLIMRIVRSRVRGQELAELWLRWPTGRETRNVWKDDDSLSLWCARGPEETSC